MDDLIAAFGSQVPSRRPLWPSQEPIRPPSVSSKRNRRQYPEKAYRTRHSVQADRSSSISQQPVKVQEDRQSRYDSDHLATETAREEVIDDEGWSAWIEGADENFAELANVDRVRKPPLSIVKEALNWRYNDFSEEVSTAQSQRAEPDFTVMHILERSLDDPRNLYINPWNGEDSYPETNQREMYTIAHEALDGIDSLTSSSTLWQDAPAEAHGEFGHDEEHDWNPWYNEGMPDDSDDVDHTSTDSSHMPRTDVLSTSAASHNMSAPPVPRSCGQHTPITQWYEAPTATARSSNVFAPMKDPAKNEMTWMDRVRGRRKKDERI